MKKIIKIKGMTCAHCQKRVENALNEIEGIKASVDLKNNEATVKLSKDVDDAVIRQAVTDAGYEVISIVEKKGLF